MPKNPKSRRKKVPLNRDAALKFFGQRVRELRIGRGMKQIELANRADFNLSYITRLERGETEPGLGLVVKIANALGVPAHELVQVSPQDPWSVMATQARQRLNAILDRQDRDALAAILPMLALAEESSARRRK